MTMSCPAAAASMRSLCSCASASCSSRRGVRRCASQKARRLSSTSATRSRRASSAACSDCASVDLPVLSAPTRATTSARGAPSHRLRLQIRRHAAGRLEPPPGAPAGDRQYDEERIEQHRQPQALVREQRDADHVDDQPGQPVLDVLARRAATGRSGCPRSGRRRTRARRCRSASPSSQASAGQATAIAASSRQRPLRPSERTCSGAPSALVPRSHCHQPQNATTMKNSCRPASP